MKVNFYDNEVKNKLNKRNIEVLTELIVFSQRFQTDLMIAKHEGMNISDVNVITDQEQYKLDESVEILKKANKQIKSMMFIKQ